MLANAFPIFSHRLELIEALINAGYEVVVSFSDEGFMENEELASKYGFKFINILVRRRTTKIHEELMLLHKYYRLIKTEKPDLVLTYTVKCTIYGGIAAKWAGVPFITNITGLGKGLEEKGIIQKILIWLYRFMLKDARVVYFQNESNKKFFIDNKIKFNRSVLLPGSGVNLKKYYALEYPENKPVVFLFNARIMKTKGIDEYLEAAEYIRAKYPDTEFHICGYCEKYGRGGGDYTEIISEAHEKGTIIYHGYQTNMIDFYKFSHCIVLPSFYSEGVPNSLLEAAACARPIITTDHPGCRETVDDGITGFLVKKQNSKDLISKIELFLSMTTEQRRKMGLKGREKMVKEFDRQKVVDEYMKEIRAL